MTRLVFSPLLGDNPAMFTGIVEESGRVGRVERRGDHARMVVAARVVLEDAHLGDSICVNGCCLTVTSCDGGQFAVDVAPETLRVTNLGDLRPGDGVNLERSVRLNDRLGGHLVSGHVDGTATVTGVRDEGNARIFTFTADPVLTRQMIQRGSVAIDGISLTLIAVDEGSFSVSIIPHTLEVTTLGHRRLGDTVNIETDLIGKYVLSFLEPLGLKGGGVDRAFLAEHGFL
jgi:riboflavin synthase